MNQKPELETNNSTIEAVEYVVKALQSKFKGEQKELHKVTSVERNKHRFDTVEAVKKEVTGTGSIRVIAQKVEHQRREGGYQVGNVHFVAFVMTNDQYGKNRDLRAELIAGRLGTFVTTAAFSQALGKLAHQQVASSNWQNLTTNAFDGIGVSMWAVTWQQECRLNVPLDLNLLDAFLTLGLTATQGAGAPELKANIKLPQEEDNE